MCPSPDFAPLDTLLRETVPRLAPAAQLVVLWQGRPVCERALGWLYPDTYCRPVEPLTRFDLASVTKLFTAAVFMQLVEGGQVALDQAVRTVLPEFDGLRPVQPYEDPSQAGTLVSLDEESASSVEAGEVTFRQLLSHTSGLPAWRPLFRQPDAASARQMALTTFFSYTPGAHAVYSDLGFILLGLAVERLSALPLDQAVQRRLLAPLDLQHTGYFPLDPSLSREWRTTGSPEERPQAFAAPTEFCSWRGRRVTGQVHDENAFRLGGVAGHAGVFSTARDVARFGQVFLDGGHPVLRPATVVEMTCLQAQEGAVRRGLGFALWSPDPEASGNPFNPASFGHTGFTGTSLWIDPARQLVITLLTNEVNYGREGRTISELRVQVHRTVVQVVDSSRTG